MSDFDFDIDFDVELNVEEYETLTMGGLLLNAESKKREMFEIGKGTKQLDALLENPPKQNQSFRMLSAKGGFSSINLIWFVAKREPIKMLYASTLRIGKKQFEILRMLKRKGLLDEAFFLTSTMQKNLDRDYDYFQKIKQMCKECNFELQTMNNHSKVILMQTAENFYVVETSSNLNENPKIEQFCFENDKRLFEWYKGFFKAVRAYKDNVKR